MDPVGQTERLGLVEGRVAVLVFGVEVRASQEEDAHDVHSTCRDVLAGAEEWRQAFSGAGFDVRVVGEEGGDGGGVAANHCEAKRGFAFVVCGFDGDAFVKGLFDSRDVTFAGRLEQR